jgi:hypothetical protein
MMPWYYLPHTDKLIWRAHSSYMDEYVPPEPPKMKPKKTTAKKTSAPAFCTSVPSVTEIDVTADVQDTATVTTEPEPEETP